MTRVRLKAPLVFNLTGYDREPVSFAAGEQDVPDVVAVWLASNKSAGTVLGESDGLDDTVVVADSPPESEPEPEPESEPEQLAKGK